MGFVDGLRPALPKNLRLRIHRPHRADGADAGHGGFYTIPLLNTNITIALIRFAERENANNRARFVSL